MLQVLDMPRLDARLELADVGLLVPRRVFGKIAVFTANGRCPALEVDPLGEIGTLRAVYEAGQHEAAATPVVSSVGLAVPLRGCQIAGVPLLARLEGRFVRS